MLSIESITSQRRKQSRLARKQGLQPFVAEVNGDENVVNAPFLGHYVPEGWRVTAKYFVDNSGFGAEDEPALTLRGFLKRVRAGFGYGIFEAGEFQVYIREYYPID